LHEAYQLKRGELYKKKAPNTTQGREKETRDKDQSSGKQKPKRGGQQGEKGTTKN
jgi:hypothetical protein